MDIVKVLIQTLLLAGCLAMFYLALSPREEEQFVVTKVDDFVLVSNSKGVIMVNCDRSQTLCDQMEQGPEQALNDHLMNSDQLCITAEKFSSITQLRLDLLQCKGLAIATPF